MLCMDCLSEIKIYYFIVSICINFNLASHGTFAYKFLSYIGSICINFSLASHGTSFIVLLYKFPCYIVSICIYRNLAWHGTVFWPVRRLCSGYGFLDNVKLGSAKADRSSAGRQVSHVELCQCPTGYIGQFCESCAPGYHRDPAGGGPYARCVPCNCNGHSDTCDVNTGELPLSNNNNNNNEFISDKTLRLYHNLYYMNLPANCPDLTLGILVQGSKLSQIFHWPGGWVTLKSY